jgi:hypothetical protein
LSLLESELNIITIRLKQIPKVIIII